MKTLTEHFEAILARRCIGRGKVMLATPHNVEVEKVNITGFIEDLLQAVKNRDAYVIGTDDNTLAIKVGAQSLDVLTDDASLTNQIKAKQRKRAKETL